MEGDIYTENLINNKNLIVYTVGRRFSLYFIGLTLLFYSSCRSDSRQSSDEECSKEGITSPFLLAVEDAKYVFDNDPEALFICVTKPKTFEAGHIPKSLNIWRSDFRSQDTTYAYGGMRCSKEELVQLLSRLGVKPSSTLYLYDTKGAVDALRFAWVLEYYGFDKYKIINGGLKSWQMAGYPISKGKSVLPAPSDFSFEANPNPSILAEIPDVIAAINDKQTVLVDTREDYEYLGKPFIAGDSIFEFKSGAFASGAIPSAVHLNWSVLSDLGDDHRIKCEKDLRYDLLNAGITPDKNIIVYCHSGSRSSHTAFVLKHILGYPNVKNYDGSWIEWSYHYMHNATVSIDQKTNEIEVETIRKTLESENNPH